MNTNQTASDSLHPPVIAGASTGGESRGFFNGMKTYSEKLKDPRWQRKRLEVMQRDDFKCSDCGDDKSQLAVHHAYYITGRKPWQYPLWSLKTLCEECHTDEHSDKNEDYNESEWEAVIGFLGIEKMSDFGFWWDMAVEMAMRSDEFKQRGITRLQWLEMASIEFSAIEFSEKNGVSNPLK